MQQIRSFFLLGILTTGIDYAIYSLLIILGIHYVAAIAIGYGCGLWANYVIGRRYIFKSGRKLKSSHQEFVFVVLIALGGMVLSMAVVKVLSYSIWSMDPLYSRFFAIIVTFFWNYIMRKLFVYH